MVRAAGGSGPDQGDLDGGDSAGRNRHPNRGALGPQPPSSEDAHAHFMCRTVRAVEAHPDLEKPLVLLDHASHVQIRGITFECSRAGGVVVKGGGHNEIVGCVVRTVVGGGIVT